MPVGETERVGGRPVEVTSLRANDEELAVGAEVETYRLRHRKPSGDGKRLRGDDVHLVELEIPYEDSIVSRFVNEANVRVGISGIDEAAAAVGWSGAGLREGAHDVRRNRSRDRDNDACGVSQGPGCCGEGEGVNIRDRCGCGAKLQGIRDLITGQWAAAASLQAEKSGGRYCADRDRSGEAVDRSYVEGQR